MTCGGSASREARLVMSTEVLVEGEAACEPVVYGARLLVVLGAWQRVLSMGASGRERAASCATAGYGFRSIIGQAVPYRA